VVVEWECFDHTDLEVANFNCEHDPSRSAVGLEANLRQNDWTMECLRSGSYQLPTGTRLIKTIRRPVG
jgi:hypothetical protein